MIWPHSSWAQYQRHQYHYKKFTKGVCSPGAQRKFQQLYDNFKNFGIYVPVDDEGKILFSVIRDKIHLLKEKIQFIEKTIQFLEEDFSPPDALRDLDKVEESVDLLAQRKTRGVSDREASQALVDNIEEFYKEILFLLNVKFPVDHLALRKSSDFTKSKEVFFERKIIEDGATDPVTKRGDKFLRALLSTIYLRVQKRELSSLIEDPLYYDLRDMIRIMKNQIQKGGPHWIKTQKDWLERTQKIFSFYQEILNDSKMDQLKYLDEKKLATEKLKEFIYQKQLQTYLYWSQLPKFYRALFVIETILTNEVGRVTDPGDWEKKEIAKLVLKREEMDRYAVPREDQPLFQGLHKAMGDEYKKYRLLNVLFKEGEFSFTYYFIASGVRVFCPDMTKLGKKLRRKNWGIAERSFKWSAPTRAVNFYSRVSMLGRIEVDSLWPNFQRLPAAPGPLMRKVPHALRERVDRGEYFLAHDVFDKGKTLLAVEIDSRRYVFAPETGQFFSYRNPYYFTYFSSITTPSD